jgi:hypothetical protein
MGFINWIGEYWFDGIQTVGIVGGLLFAGYTNWKEQQARKISNSIAINEQHERTWDKFYDRPKLARVLATEVDLKKEPVSIEEELFVTRVTLNLSTSFRAIRHGELVKFEGLQKDVKAFFSLPVPQAIWKNLEKFQDKDFVKFVEKAIG